MENFYGRDLIAGVLAGVAGIAALPVLLLAADRDLGDDQDGLQSEIAAVLDADPVAGRELILDQTGSDAPERRGHDRFRRSSGFLRHADRPK